MPTAAIGAGTTIQMSDMQATPVFTDIPGITSIGATGGSASQVEVTPLASTTKEYIAGLFDGPDKELSGYWYAGDLDQQALRTAAEAGQLTDFKINFSDGTVADVTIALLGFELQEPEAEGAIMFVVRGKQSGPVTWA